jgi:hypothetical protein
VKRVREFRNVSPRRAAELDREGWRVNAVMHVSEGHLVAVLVERDDSVAAELAAAVERRSR